MMNRAGGRRAQGILALGLLTVIALGGCAAQAATLAPTATPIQHIVSKYPVPDTTPTTPEATPTNVVIAGTPGVSGPTCQSNQLSLTIEQDGVAMGNVGEWGKLTNHSSTACSLYGFPSVQPLDAQRRPMAVHVNDQTRAYLYSLAAQPVRLVGGGAAYFIIEFTDVPSGTATTCPVSSYLAVTPPNDSSALTVAGAVDDCDGNLYISPVEPNQHQFMGS